MIKIFTDGASRGNPGKAGAGVAFYDEENNLIREVSIFLGEKTNNEAEYGAVIIAIKTLVQMGYNEAQLYSDSEFLVKQVNGLYKVKAKNIIPLFRELRDLLKGLKVKFSWIPRGENEKADELANQAIDVLKPVRK